MLFSFISLKMDCQRKKEVNDRMKFFVLALEKDIDALKLMEIIRTEHPDGKIIVKHMAASTAAEIMNK